VAQGSLSKNYETWCLVVDEQELRRLCDEIQKALNKDGANPPRLDFEVTLSDHFSYHTASLEDVLREENSRRKSIKGLSIESENNEDGITVRLGSGTLQYASLAVKGQDRQWVYVVFSVLEDRLRRLKQWYPRTGLCAIIGASIGVALWIWTFGALSQKYGNALVVPLEAGKYQFTGPGSALFMILAVIYCGGLAYAAARLFPNVTFRIGDGISCHDRLKSVRSRLFWLLVGTGGLGTLYRLANKFLL
jgi:hypothetical protein